MFTIFVNSSMLLNVFQVHLKFETSVGCYNISYLSLTKGMRSQGVWNTTRGTPLI